MAIIKCSECGYEFSEYATACPKCGCPTSKIIEENKLCQNESSGPEENKGSCLGKFLAFGLTIFFIFIVFYVISNNGNSVDCQNNGCESCSESENTDGSEKLLSRSARNSDISIAASEEFSFNMNYKLTAKKDISGLQITFYFKNSSKSTIETKVKNIGNVKENQTYTVSFSLGEFSLSDAWNIKYFSWTVTGGTVSYFA